MNLPARIHLCAAHFLKNMVRKPKKVSLENAYLKSQNERSQKPAIFKEIRKVFIFSFTLIQNCICLDQAKLYLQNIYNVFNNQSDDETVAYSLAFIQNEIIHRNIYPDPGYFRDSSDVDDTRRFEEIKYLKELRNIEKNIKSKETIVACSPFTSYFQAVFKTFKVCNAMA